MDVPGRASQMPQILAKSGIGNLFISRFNEWNAIAKASGLPLPHVRYACSDTFLSTGGWAATSCRTKNTPSATSTRSRIPGTAPESSCGPGMSMALRGRAWPHTAKAGG